MENFKKTIKNMVMMRDQNHICHINYKLRQFSENLYLDKVACSELDLYPKIKSYFGMEILSRKILNRQDKLYHKSGLVVISSQLKLGVIPASQKREDAVTISIRNLFFSDSPK